MPEVLAMKNCPQPKNFHSEGDVWNHSRLTLEKLSSPEFKGEFGNEEVSEELIFSSLFHDIGKTLTIQTPEKDNVPRIRFYEHDIKGAKIAQDICERLKLSSYQGKVGAENIRWLVKNHMLFTRGTVLSMKNSTIEKYFFSKIYPSRNLLKLIFADIISTIHDTGQPYLDNYWQAKQRIKEIERVGYKDNTPNLLLNGREIMKEFNLQSGPKIGELLSALREEQLSKKVKTKKQALEFLKKYLKKFNV
jgi:putative nucleotidyltransferase with HDIG domain